MASTIPPFNADSFWNSSFSEQVQHPATLVGLLKGCDALPATSFFDLTFYASFATRILIVMKREGPDSPAFGRMQQSFTEAVGKVREIMQQLERQGILEARRYQELSHVGLEKLIELMEDLSIVKLWQNELDTSTRATNERPA